MKKQLLSLLFFAWMPVAFSQSLTATTDKISILLGEPFHVQLKGTFPQGKEMWPALDSVPHFEILDRSQIDTQRNYLGTTLTQDLTLISWDSGRWQLPQFTAAKGEKPITISVSFTSPFDPKQPYNEIKDIIEVKKPVTTSWYWYLIFGVVLLALFILFFPKEKKKPATHFVPDTNAYQKALKAIDALEKQNPPSDQFYTEMIRIFREYLHRRKNIQSYSKTTDDLAVQLSALNLPRPAYGELVQALRLADLVRFARFSPGTEENRASLHTVREGIVQLEGSGNAV